MLGIYYERALKLRPLAKADQTVPLSSRVGDPEPRLLDGQGLRRGAVLTGSVCREGSVRQMT